MNAQPTNPYAASTEAAQPRSRRNLWRLLAAVGLLFVLPSLILYGYLRYERANPTLFQAYEDATMGGKVDRWQEMHDRNLPTSTVAGSSKGP